MIASRDDVVEILRIKLSQVFHRYTDFPVYLGKMQILFDFESICLHRHSYILRYNSVFFAVCHSIHRSHECRHITSGLTWKISVYGPVVLASPGPSDGL